MTKLGVAQQIAALRPTVGYAPHFHNGLLICAALGAVAAAVFWHPIPLMVAAFMAVIGFSEQRAGSNIRDALQAYDTGTPTAGEVNVSITRWDTDNHYHAVVHERGHPDWKFEFVPQGWTPEQSVYPARIWRTEKEQYPILVVTGEGIMIPRYAPTQSTSEN